MGSSLNEHRNPWLDVIRTLAILLVLLSHGRALLLPLWDGFNVLKFGGFLGVELFFVLSGYLIGGIILDAIEAARGPFAWVKTFWVRRWMRTVPNYVLFLMVNMVLLSIGIRQADSPDLFSYATFTQNLAWPHPSFFPEAWSLATEEVFYAVAPLLIGSVLLLGVGSRKAMVIVAMMVFAFSLLLRNLIVLQADPAWDEGVRKISLLRLDALMVGVLLAVWGRSSFFLRLTPWLSIFLCMLLLPTIYVAVQPNNHLNQSWFARVLLFPMASLGCAGLISVGISVTVKGVVRQVFEALARWSYSAYLAHLPVLSMIFFFLKPSAANVFTLASAWILFFVATLIVSSLVYRYYETFFLRLRERLVA